MANIEVAGADERSKALNRSESEQITGRGLEETASSNKGLVPYSLSSPEFRQAVRRMPVNELADHSIPTLLRAPDIQGTLASPELPSLLKAPKPLTPGEEILENPRFIKPNVGDKPALQTVPVAPAEQMEDKNKSIDPCTKKFLSATPAPADVPKAMDFVRDRDPELYKQIQVKVTDPRYTGELGNITVSTHDKNGRVNGCVFVQNVPYWESGAAAQALIDVNRELAKKGKKLEADPLNGAGRTLAQEEAIVWRNSGVHAKVGKSNHGFGKAEDFKLNPDPAARRQPWEDPFVNATLHAHGWRQGDSYGPLKNDLHHWSFVGMGPATDGHLPAHKTPIKHHKHR